MTLRRQTLVSKCLACSYLSKVYFSIAWLLGLLVSLVLLLLLVFWCSFWFKAVFLVLKEAWNKALPQLHFASRHVSSKSKGTETMQLYRCLFSKTKHVAKERLFVLKIHAFHWGSFKTCVHFWHATSKNVCMLKSANLEIHEFLFKEHAFWKFSLIATTKFCTY